MIRFKQATKMARFLTCSGKSAIPNPNALGGDMTFIDSIHTGGDAAGSGESSRLLRPRTMSRAPIVMLMTRPIVVTVLAARPERMSAGIGAAGGGVRWPGGRALAW